MFHFFLEYMYSEKRVQRETAVYSIRKRDIIQNYITVCKVSDKNTSPTVGCENEF